MFFKHDVDYMLLCSEMFSITLLQTQVCHGDI